jgi:hypothetical protein
MQVLEEALQASRTEAAALVEARNAVNAKSQAITNLQASSNMGASILALVHVLYFFAGFLALFADSLARIVARIG